MSAMLDNYKKEHELGMSSLSGLGEKSSSNGFFIFLEKHLGLEQYFKTGFPVRNLPKILFVLVLILIYISNAHYAEEGIRKINRLQVTVEDLRTDYITLKADLMLASKQSEVAKKVQPLGLKESVSPPYKILLEDGEY